MAFDLYSNILYLIDDVEVIIIRVIVFFLFIIFTCMCLC